jgi:type III pantothenate kinase
MKLLVDIGNTRLKWGVSQQHTLTMTGALLANALDTATLTTAWQPLSTPDIVAIACVNAPHWVELVRTVCQTLWPGCLCWQVQSQALQCGVHNAYPNASSLGIDRWLALIAAHQYYQQDSCIVDCGTAITIDIINQQGQHLGGLISPGLALMRQALAQGTQQLPHLSNDYVVGLANNTAAGIYSGVILAACGLIEQVRQRYAHNAQLLLTGGDATLIAQYLSCDSLVNEHLVLKGLSYVAEEIR